jgi:diaminohydroxyphosphoribosylaminopyrimidine deaminase/5-amino-6-(5-phosphoribosylamino)uracil reductase
LAYLKNSGINVLMGERAEVAEKLIEGYKKYIVNEMPFVTVKYAMSLDGKIASKNMDSKWISSENSRSYVQKMRNSMDAIMVGSNTVRQDNPNLTVRDEAGEPIEDQPLRVIIGGDRIIDSRSNVLKQPGDVLIAVARAEMVDSLQKSGFKVECMPDSNGKVDLVSFMNLLASKYEITNILVEGGGKLIGALFDLSLVDKIAVFVSPLIIGGEQAITGVGGQGVELIKDAFRLNDVQMTKLDSDILITGSIK